MRFDWDEYRAQTPEVVDEQELTGELGYSVGPGPSGSLVALLRHIQVVVKHYGLEAPHIDELATLARDVQDDMGMDPSRDEESLWD